MPLIPAFQLHLNNSILSGLATVGKFDGEHPCLACGTSSGKVFIHSPHEKSESSALSIRFLNINRRITALAAGALAPGLGRDTLLVGTQTNLLAYDVENNSDVFYKDASDGVNTIVLGYVSSVKAPLAIVGGTCSIQGFDKDGVEAFWTVTGDNVGALALVDVDQDGVEELVVGSDDYDIRVFREEEVIMDTTETDKITALTPLYDNKFGYALANGTVGVYSSMSRVWRVKSKNQPTCITGFDLDADGVPELVTGWSSGKVEVRKDVSGKVIFKTNFSTAVSALVTSDYRMDQRSNLICCALDGEVRGFLASEDENLMESKQDDKTVSDLLSQKQELMLQLQGVEENIRQLKSGEQSAGVIPSNTRVNLSLQASQGKQCVQVVLSTNNTAVIHSVLMFSLEGDGDLFEGESHVERPSPAASTVYVPIRPKKNTASTLSIKVLVGARPTSQQFHVFEIEHQLPKFSMHVSTGAAAQAPPPQAWCHFFVPERVSRVSTWLNESFIIAEPIALGADSVEGRFLSLVTGKPLIFKMTNEKGGKVVIRTDDMELAAELVQHLCAFLGVTELESAAEFPEEMAAFRDVLLRVDEFNAIRLRLTAEMADSSHSVKTLVIKSEDARMLGDMATMKALYTELHHLNTNLIGEYVKRANNHSQLLAALKDVNHMIQKAARLRVGSAKTRVVTACRQAIKSNNIQSLFQIILHGHAGQ